MINYLSLFSGIGAFEAAMKNLNIPFSLVGFSEIDKHAVKSYCAIHDVPETFNLGDITKIDETKLPKVDFVTYGFPCQDISLAGKQQGLFNDDGTKTRSGLFFDALRIIEHTQPKVAIAENVKNLTSKKFAEQFKIVLDALEEVGYNNYFKVLNAKDFGIPQNRERVFIVSIRKDCDTGIFEFPEPYSLKLRLKDVLEDAVDERFYLSEKGTSGIINAMTDGRLHKPNVLRPDALYSPTIDTRVGAQTHRSPYIEEPKVKQIGNCRPTKTRANPNQGRVYDVNGISPCLHTMGGGNLEPHIIEKSAEEIVPTVKENHGEVTIQKVGNIYPSGGQNGNIYAIHGISPTIASGETNTKGNGGVGSNNSPKILQENLRIRKLTPKECFRLMGFDDEAFHKAEAVNSNTQLYKQAGNSIVVDVAEELLCMLFDENGDFFI